MIALVYYARLTFVEYSYMLNKNAPFKFRAIGCPYSLHGEMNNGV